MKRILTILTLLLTVAFLSWGQDIKPISPLFKNLQSPSFSFMIGGNPWIYKGSTFNPNPWTELAGWTNVKDTLTNYWSKIEITPSDTTRWGNGDAIQFVYKNGIHKDADSVKLGGSLTEDTEINVDGKLISIYDSDHGIIVQPITSTMYVDNDSTQMIVELDDKYLTIRNDFANTLLGNRGGSLEMWKDTVLIRSIKTPTSEKTSSFESRILPERIETYQYKNRGSHIVPYEVKRGTVQDTTGIRYINIPESYFQDSTLVPKYYVDNLITSPDSLKEDKSNKENTTVDNSTTKYPTVNLLKTYADTKDPSISNEGSLTVTDKTSYSKNIHSNTTGSIDIVVKVDSIIPALQISRLNNKITICADTTFLIKKSTVAAMYQPKINNSQQHLSGTNVTWNLANGKDADITLTGNTVITITNATQGLSGTLWVTNASSTYTITFAGYINSIDPFIRLNSNMVITSGGGKSDDYTYKYNGTKLNWNGTLNRN